MMAENEGKKFSIEKSLYNFSNVCAKIIFEVFTKRKKYNEFLRCLQKIFFGLSKIFFGMIFIRHACKNR